MKKRFNIIALISAMLLLFGITTQAQSANNKLELDSDGSFSMDISTLISAADYKKHFTNIIHVTRVDSNTILLQSKEFLSPNIRIELNNGNPHVCRRTEYRFNINLASDRSYLKYQIIMEDEDLSTPLEAKYCWINSIDQAQDDITISIYQHKQNKLLAKKTYMLNSFTSNHYKARLVQNQVFASDGWGKDFKVISFRLNFFDSMESMGIECTGNTLSPKAINKIAQKPRGKSYYICDIKVIGNDGKTYVAEPIEIK